MAANIEQIFRDFVVNKIKEIEDESQDIILTDEDHPNGKTAEGADGINNTQDKDGVANKEEGDVPQKKHRKHKKHKKHKSKKKKRKEEKGSGSESAADSDGDKAKTGEEDDGRSKRHKRHSGKKKKKKQKKDGDKSNSSSGSESESKPQPGNKESKPQDLPDIIPKLEEKSPEKSSSRRSRSRSGKRRSRDRRGRSRSRSGRRRGGHTRSRSRHRRSGSHSRRSGSARRGRRTRSRSLVILKKDRRSRSRSRRRSKSKTRSQSRHREMSSGSPSPSRNDKSRSASKDSQLVEKDPSAALAKDESAVKDENVMVPIDPPALASQSSIDGVVNMAAATGGGWKPIPFLGDSSKGEPAVSSQPSECLTSPQKCPISPEVPSGEQHEASTDHQSTSASDPNLSGQPTGEPGESDGPVTSETLDGSVDSLPPKTDAGGGDKVTPQGEELPASPKPQPTSGEAEMTEKGGESSKSRSPSKRKKSRSKSPGQKKRSDAKSSKKRRSRSKSPGRKRKSRSSSPSRKRKSRTPSRRKRSRSKSGTRKKKSRSKSRTRNKRSKSRSPKRKRSKSRSPARRSKRSRSRSGSRRRGRGAFGSHQLSQRDRWKREPSHSPVLILRKKRSPARTNRDTSKSPPRLTELDKDQLLEIAKANAAAMCAKAGIPIPESLRPKAVLQLPLPNPMSFSMPMNMNMPMNMPMNMSMNMPMSMTMNAAMASMTAATMTAALASMGSMASMQQMAPLPSITNKPPPGPPQPNMATIEDVKRKVAKQANSISIKEFTDKCKKIVEKGGELALAEPRISDDEDDGKPFGRAALREVKGISFSLNNASVRPSPALAVRSEAAFAKEFPVSSGSQHRKKEGDGGGAYGEWVTVDKKAEKAKAAATKALATAAKETSPGDAPLSAVSVATEEPAVVTESDSVFPEPPLQPVDITQAVGERMKAQKRLAENPYDVSAICMLSRAQEQVLLEQRCSAQRSCPTADHRPGSKRYHPLSYLLPTHPPHPKHTTPLPYRCLHRPCPLVYPLHKPASACSLITTQP
eukprot:XP_014007304.1 PREDICTED: protein SON-like isoform X2 [Salmo salar]